jgi:hypothetical protein
VFLAGVVVVGVAGAVYKVNQAQSGYQNKDDTGE